MQNFQTNGTTVFVSTPTADFPGVLILFVSICNKKNTERKECKTQYYNTVIPVAAWTSSNGSLFDDSSWNKCSDGAFRVQRALKSYRRHWLARCCSCITEQVSKQTALVYIRREFSMCCLFLLCCLVTEFVSSILPRLEEVKNSHRLKTSRSYFHLC